MVDYVSAEGKESAESVSKIGDRRTWERSKWEGKI